MGLKKFHVDEMGERGALVDVGNWIQNISVKKTMSIFYKIVAKDDI